MRRFLRLMLFIAVAAVLCGCGYNAIQHKDEAARAAWSELINQYKQRADLVPNLVNTVQGHAQQERQVLTEVTDARARVGLVQVNADDQASLQQFQQAQGQLGDALSRLLLLRQNYPELESDQNFRDLQAQLQDAEGRISSARSRYIRSVQAYNSHIRSFPQVFTAKLFGYQPRPNFSVDAEARLAPPAGQRQPATMQ